MSFRIYPPVHPGKILREEYMEPLGLTAYALAKKLRTSRARIERLSREQVPVTVDTALRLGRFFGTTPDFWMNLQTSYDLTLAEDQKAPWLDDIPVNAAA
ncbi:MAG TPA: HigA family addiction module antitoxin [Devosia sp.]|jgi:addiction module HigA family antidote|nr:HigA family addiction module antitoxin [Devosia sp.]